MKLKFSKMHGLGNDFVVIDAIRQPVEITPALARQLGDRRFGIGCDQLLVVEPAQQAGVDFRYRIFNNDGSEVEQCGNGARCFARFVFDQGLTTKTSIRVETRAGVIEPRLAADGMVTVDMGVPIFEPARIPFESDSDAAEQPLDVAGVSVSISAVSMGNPHAVQIVTDVDAAPVGVVGPLIEQHPRFPARVNAGFMQIVDRQQIRLRVYERGAGETLACGTGACAAAVVGQLQGKLGPKVRVDLPGGTLTIRWKGGDAPVRMTGPAEHVFDGAFEL